MSVIRNNYQQNWKDVTDYVRVYFGWNVGTWEWSDIVGEIRDRAVAEGKPGRNFLKVSNIAEANMIFQSPSEFERWKQAESTYGFIGAFNRLVCSYPLNLRYCRGLNNVVGVDYPDMNSATRYEYSSLVSDIHQEYEDYSIQATTIYSQYEGTVTITHIQDLRNWEQFAIANGPISAIDDVDKAWKKAGNIRVFIDAEGAWRGDNGRPIGTQRVRQ